MLTVILSAISETTDTSQYTGLLKDGDSIHVVGGYKKTVEKYNEIIQKSAPESDILLLSDSIDLHGNVCKEMNSCLYAGERHAIACGMEIENNESLIESARKYLPKYTTSIKIDISCVMIKRSVIRMLGLFDASYNSLQYAVLDYYCRLNTYGFSAVIAHHALFSHNDRKHSDGVESDEGLFSGRYNYRKEKEKRFALYGTNPCVEFLKVIDKDYYPKKRILFDCAVMPPTYCGTSEFQISTYDAFYRLYKDKYDIFMYINREADEYHKLSSRYDNVFYPDTICGKFHLGFAPNQLLYVDTQKTMNEHCLSVTQTMLDIMTVRNDEHFDVGTNGEVELGIKLSDGIVFISNYSENDFKAYFVNESSIKDKIFKVVYPAADPDIHAAEDCDKPFKDYFLVFGNSFRHKAIKETIGAVSDAGYNFIVVGCESDGYILPNVYGYKSGHISEDYLNCLYANCAAVIFPSLYEGFGLPIVISLKYNKRIIANDNALNRELMDKFHQFKDLFYLFDDFKQIGGIIEGMDFSVEKVHLAYSDSWDRVAIELESFFEEVLNADVNTEKLYDRWHMYKPIEMKESIRKRQIGELGADLAWLHGQFNNYKLCSLLRFALRANLVNRHPGFLNFLRKLKRLPGQ